MTHWKKTSDTVDRCGKQHSARAVVIGVILLSSSRERENL
jgi:hypothetical protein